MDYRLTQISNSLNAAAISMTTEACSGTTVIELTGGIPDEPEILNYFNELMTTLLQ
jgi:hypothetical protein